MPRGPVVFTLPPGTTPQSPGDVIQSAVWNAAMDDFAQTFNTIQPEEYGGTGAATFQGALDNLFDGINTVNGVRFPETQVPSSNPNVLDDYEEGSFSPTIGASVGSITSVTATLKYTKIGNLVTFSAHIVITNNGTGGVIMTMTLPFPSAVQSSATGRESAVNGKTITGVVNAGSSSMFFVNYDNSYPGVNNGVYSIFGSYQV